MVGHGESSAPWTSSKRWPVRRRPCNSMAAGPE
jgi:hypothetical protein